MARLTERVRLLEGLLLDNPAAPSELDRLPPEQLAGVLREGIHAMENRIAEGRGDEPLQQARPRRNEPNCATEALPFLRAVLVDLERDHALAH